MKNVKEPANRRKYVRYNMNGLSPKSALARLTFDVDCLVVDPTAIADVAPNNGHYLKAASPTTIVQIQH